MARWGGVGLWTAFWISLALVARLATRSREVSLQMARRGWAPGTLAILGARLEVTGPAIEPDRAWYFAANHQSLVDIPALFRGLPVPIHFVAKSELGNVPFIGWYIRGMGMVLVDRKRRASGAAGADQMTTLLREGRSVISFSAGTRSADGLVQRFKSGGFAAAIDAEADIVPIAIWGAHRVLPANSFLCRSGTVHLRLGEPIRAADYTREDRHELADRVQAEVERLQRELQDEERPRLSPVDPDVGAGQEVVEGAFRGREAGHQKADPEQDRAGEVTEPAE